MTSCPLLRAKTALFAGVALIVLVAPFAVIARDGNRHVASQAQPIQIVGASVLLRLQREGTPVYDFRRTGQAIPGAVRANDKTAFSHSHSLALIGDENQLQPLAQRLSQHNPQTEIYIVPSYMVEAYPAFPGVRQVEPREFAKMQSRDIPVFDFAEAEEFEFARVAGSTRVPWAEFIAGDRSFLPPRDATGKSTIALICPVGSRSQIAAQKLEREGIRVLNVRGGMIAWQNAKLPVEGKCVRRRTHGAH